MFDDIPYFKWKVLALMIVLAVLPLFPGEKHDPAWNSKQAVADLQAAMRDFCKELYESGNCPRVSTLGKTSYLVTATFSHEAAPSIDSVEDVLTRQGWHDIGRRAPGELALCRGPYVAQFSIEERLVAVTFMSGDRRCRDLLPFDP